MGGSSQRCDGFFSNCFREFAPRVFRVPTIDFYQLTLLICARGEGRGGAPCAYYAMIAAAAAISRESSMGRRKSCASVAQTFTIVAWKGGELLRVNFRGPVHMTK